MKVQIKTLYDKDIVLGDCVDVKPYSISVDHNNQQIVTITDNIVKRITTHIFIKDLITITDTDGNSISIDSDTDPSIIYNISPIINVRTIGHRHLGSNQRVIDSVHIELWDAENRFEILINKDPKHYEVSVYLI